MAFETIADHDLIFFGSAKHYSPHAAIKMDNNAEIIQGLRKYNTMTELKEQGYQFNRSQIQVLIDWNIIQMQPDRTLKVILPIYDGDKIEELRWYTSKFAEEIMEHTLNQFTDLLKYLDPKSAHAIIFSVIIDNMLWDELKYTQNINTTIDKDNPFWAGLFYAVYPKREKSCGTNSFANNDKTLCINWNENCLGKIQEISKELDLLLRWYAGEKVDIEPLSKLGLIENNEVTIPVVKGEVKEQSIDITKSIAQYVQEKIDLNYLGKLLDLENESEIMVPVLHEIIWDMMDIMREKKIITSPKVFDGKGDIKEIFVIID